MVMVYLPNDAETIRIGVVAGKPIGKAVQRNRAKRLIRSALQPFLHEISPGWDILMIARKDILAADFHDILEAVRSLLLRSLLIQRDE